MKPQPAAPPGRTRPAGPGRITQGHGPLPFSAALHLILLLLAAAGLPRRIAAQPAPPDPQATGNRLSGFLAQPAFEHASWGILALRADTGSVVYQTNAHRLLKPASSAKVLTAAFALDTLGPAHRLRTDLIPTGTIRRSGTLHGDLVIQGRGDFSLSTRFHGGPPSSSLDPLVDALSHAGLRRITGALVVDDSHHTDPPFGGGWTWDDLQFYYGAALGTLNVDDNVLDFTVHPGQRPGDAVSVTTDAPLGDLRFITRNALTGPEGSPRRIEVRRDPGSPLVRITGSIPVGGAAWKDAVTVPDPDRHFALRLHQALTARGIRVNHPPRVDTGAAHRLPPSSRQPLPPPIAVESRPLAERLKAMLKPSQNLYAQLLLLEAGASVPTPTASPPPPAETSESRALRALAAFLQRAGVPPGEACMDDGSGLSRSTLVTPTALVRTLQSMDRHPSREIFLDALPIAGVDGTLRTRLRGTASEGDLRAKTGSLRFVNTLTGFVTNAAGHRLVFALMLNAYQPPSGAPSGREAIDRAVDLLVSGRD